MPGADPARRLLAAFLLRAALNALEEDPALAHDARQWLAGEGAAIVSESGIRTGDPEQVAAWVGDLPPLAQLSLW